MNQVDFETTVGRVELWDLVNTTTAMDYPIHFHGAQFQIFSRIVEGVVTVAAYLVWFDTVNVPAGQTVTIKTRQMLAGRRISMRS